MQEGRRLGGEPTFTEERQEGCRFQHEERLQGKMQAGVETLSVAKEYGIPEPHAIRGCLGLGDHCQTEQDAENQRQVLKDGCATE
jgi:hypothetical protein